MKSWKELIIINNFDGVCSLIQLQYLVVLHLQSSSVYVNLSKWERENNNAASRIGVWTTAVRLESLDPQANCLACSDQSTGQMEPTLAGIPMSNLAEGRLPIGLCSTPVLVSRWLEVNVRPQLFCLMQVLYGIPSYMNHPADGDCQQ